MSRGRSNASQKKHLVASVCVVAFFVGFLHVFQGSFFGFQSSGSFALEYKGKSLKRISASYLGANDDIDGKQDVSLSSLGQGDREDDIVSKSFLMLNFSNNNLNNEGNLQTVLDVGYGVASFGAYLLSSDVIAMSLAPNDMHQNQIQFALERGIPAYLAVLGTKRLLYPSRSFELAHCSRCRIDWLQRDGILLLKLDRLLTLGVYFAYSFSEAYAQDEEDLRIWRDMSALVRRMCWKIAAKKDQIVIFQKLLTNDCYMQRGTHPSL